MAEHPDTLSGNAHALGPQLEPALVDACDGALRDIHWFRTDWQRSGAATAYATVELDDGPRQAVVKLPVGPTELRITRGLCDSPAPTPRVAFCGEELGGWDLCWIVMERLPGDPLAAHLHSEVFAQLADAAAAFYAHAERTWPTIAPRHEWDWPALLEKAQENAREHAIVEEQLWRTHLRDVKRHFDSILRAWDARPRDTWCHGDLHPGNLMRRDEASPWGEAGPVLLDFAETHPGHWSEDAIYMERLFWARPEILKEARPVQTLRRARKALGLPAHEEDTKLLDIRRVLIAATVPAFIDRDGHPAYLKAALGVLEKTLPRVLAEV
ncbi:MAG: hypothetical protein Tsb0013_03530 [Phycisphaerales bacterium]